MSAAYIPAAEHRYQPGSQGLQRGRLVPSAAIAGFIAMPAVLPEGIGPYFKPVARSAAPPSRKWLAAIGLLLAVLLTWAKRAVGIPDADGAATNDWACSPTAVLFVQRLLLLRRS